MVDIYYIRYYHGHDSTFDYTDVKVHTSTSSNVSGVTFIPVLPSKYGSQSYNTGTTKKITYKPLNRSGQDTLGISWSVNEPIIKTYSSSSWSSFDTGSSVAILDLHWQSNAIEGNVRNFVHTVYKDVEGEYVKLSLPEKYEFNGFYSVSDVTYLTVNYGYNKPSKQISLNSQVYSRVTVNYWNSGEGDELTPGTSVLVPTGIVADTYSGPYSSITYHTRSNAKTYSELLSGIDTTRPEEDCSFQVTLKSNPEELHVSEQLNVAAYKQYQFNTWKTDSGTLDLSKKPSTSNVTVYADWTHTGTVVRTTFPEWTTDQLLPYGSDPIRYVTLRCYMKAQGDEYYSKQFGVYVSKKGKHIKWSDGSSEYSIASTIPLNTGAEYTAVWEADASAAAVEGIPGNTMQIPDPPQRPGYTYLGVASVETAKIPEYDPGATIRVESDTTLWAVWKANGSGHLFDGTSYKLYQIYIYDGNNWKLYLPKIYNGTDWNTVYM